MCIPNVLINYSNFTCVSHSQNSVCWLSKFFNIRLNIFILICHFYVDGFVPKEAICQNDNNLFLIAVAPDAIHHHIKTCRTNMKNIHFVAPEYGSKCRLLVHVNHTFLTVMFKLLIFSVKIRSHRPLIYIHLECVLWRWPR